MNDWTMRETSSGSRAWPLVRAPSPCQKRHETEGSSFGGQARPVAALGVQQQLQQQPLLLPGRTNKKKCIEARFSCIKKGCVP
eukprot:1159962-Pelagomonas_calceolata.AAC.16